MIDDLEPSWRERLLPRLLLPELEGLRGFVEAAYRERTVYPQRALLFRAFDLVRFDQVQVVLLGQDPYHRGQATGLSFAVADGFALPGSLRNIFTELRQDVGGAPNNGCLEGWARQGVLLLNTVLTVEQGRPASHRNKGWEALTDAVIAALSAERDGLVFLLWGAHARAKAPLIDAQRHLVLETSHPSSLSARHGFFGCRHFGRANAYLLANGQPGIDWTAA